MELLMRKLPGGQLIPVDDESAADLQKIKGGAIVRVTIRRMRKVEFHRKMFALFKVLYDVWCETVPKMEYKGQPVAPNMERFRKDITILAGYYEATVNLKGEVRLEAKSISFANMDQDEFEALFSAVLNVGLAKVLTNSKLDEQTVRQAVDQLMQFDQ